MYDRASDIHEDAIIEKVKRIVGYVPVGTKDLLHVLVHPDVMAHTKLYVEARDRENNA